MGFSDSLAPEDRRNLVVVRMNGDARRGFALIRPSGTFSRKREKENQTK